VSAGFSAAGERISGAPLGQRPTSIEAKCCNDMPNALALPAANFQNAGTSCRKSTSRSMVSGTSGNPPIAQRADSGGAKKQPTYTESSVDKCEDYTCRDCAQDQHSEHRVPEKAASRLDSRTDDMTVFRMHNGFLLG
jgi:hypothetical protein